MRKRKYSDEEFLEGFRAGNKKIINAFSDITFPRVLKYVERYNGTRDNAKDITQDGYEALFEKSLKKNFGYHGSLVKYYLGICKNKWWISVGNDKKAHIYDPDQPTFQEEDSTSGNEQIELMDRIMAECRKLLDKVCQKIITLRLKGKSYDFIANQLNIGSSKRARDKKYRCVKKLNQLVINHKLYSKLTDE
jgi:RNA polymerase sigma factor (sigma-70 family)